MALAPNNWQLTLAAVSFADPLMLAGLVAALVPVVLHLLNRMRAPVVPFPTLRFLRITAQKTARRRQIQQYFLLFVRVIVFALIAMAVAAPLIRGGSPTLAYGLVAMLLGGLVLLVLAGVLGAAALDTAKIGKSSVTQDPGATTPRRRSAAPYWGFSLAAIVAALVLGGYSAYGLVSDRYFSGDRGEFSGRSTAAVIILDNSHSMLATEDSRTRLARAKEQVRQLLAEAIRPAEAAIVPTNPGDQPPPPLTTDMTRLLGYLDKLSAQGSARPMQERIRTALEMLRGSMQPNKMLIIASDFTRQAFSDAEVFAALKGLAWRNDLQVVLMPIRRGGAAGAAGAGAGVADVGIVSFGLAEGTQRPAVGAEVTFEAEVVNNNDTADVRDLVFTVDGKPAEAGARGGSLNPRVQLGAAGTGSARATVRVPYRLAQTGMHRFGLELQDAHDAMAWDDRRELMLDVAEQVRVLVIGAEPPDNRGQPRARSAAFYFAAALAPFEGAPGGAKVPWSIKPTYRGIDQVANVAALNGYAAVFLCDVPKVPQGLADGLISFAAGGGRIIWVLGPSVDAAAYNQILLGPGHDLLPAPLGQPLVAAKAFPLDWVDLRSGVFMNLFESQEPFRAVLVTGRWSLTGDLDRGRVLAKLSDGAPLFVQHDAAAGAAGAQGTGKTYTLLTTPAAAWSNLGGTSLMVPLASRMALGDFAAARGQTSVEAGQMVTLRLPESDAAAIPPPLPRGASIDVTTPDNAVINIKAADAGAAPGAGGARWFFDRTLAEGEYRWKVSESGGAAGGVRGGMFVVNPPGEEADLLPADVESLAKESSPAIAISGKQTIVAGSAAELLGQLEKRSEGASLMPGFLAMVLIFAVVEALMANRYRAGTPMPAEGPAA